MGSGVCATPRPNPSGEARRFLRRSAKPDRQAPIQSKSGCDEQQLLDSDPQHVLGPSYVEHAVLVPLEVTQARADAQLLEAKRRHRERRAS